MLHSIRYSLVVSIFFSGYTGLLSLSHAGFYGIGAVYLYTLIGGLGSLRGALIASAFMVLLPEVLRFVGMPDSIAANMRQIIYGIVLIGVIVWQEKIEIFKKS